MSNAQPNDSDLAVPDSIQTWFAGSGGNGATTSSNVSLGAFDFSITVELYTDQFLLPEAPQQLLLGQAWMGL